MKTNRAPRLLVAVAVMVLSACRLSAQAQISAKVNYMEGEASLQSGGRGEWLKLEPGDTINVTDNFWAYQNSRAELVMGGLVIGINSETSLTVETADENRIELKLWLGSIMVRFAGDPHHQQIGIETPNLRFALNQPGEYRLDVNARGDETIATVWSGEGESTGGGARYVIHASERADLKGTDRVELGVEQASTTDDFDEWAFRRDQMIGPARASGEPGGKGARPTEPADGSAEAGPDDAGAVEWQGAIPIGCHRPWCELDPYPNLQQEVQEGLNVWWPAAGLPCDPVACGPVIFPDVAPAPVSSGLFPLPKRPPAPEGADREQTPPFPPPAPAAVVGDLSRVPVNREGGATKPPLRLNPVAMSKSSPPAAEAGGEGAGATLPGTSKQNQPH